MTVNEFIEKYLPFAKIIEGEYGIPVSLSLSQAGLESGWGKSIPEGSNNLFGVKSSDGYASIEYNTMEDDGTGNLSKTKAGFNIYDSPLESFEHYAKVLYKDHFINKGWQSADNSIEMITRIQSGESDKYATDIYYVDKITEIINDYDLQSLDVIGNENTWKFNDVSKYMKGDDNPLITDVGEGNPWKNIFKAQYWKNLVTGNFQDNFYDWDEISKDKEGEGLKPIGEAVGDTVEAVKDGWKDKVSGIVAGTIIIIVVIIVIITIVLMVSKGGNAE